jgi:hydroxymethylpyrimidine pyrophosphatase-like HAD family hydrolase
MLVALDVDGTLFDGERVVSAAVDAVVAAADSGHHMVIISGRRHDSLVEILPPALLTAMSCCVCENGGVLVDAEGDLHLLAPALDPRLVAALRAAGVPDLDVGTVAIGGPVTHVDAIVAARDEVGSAHVVVINKDSAALLPPGCDKGSGLLAAIDSLGVHGIEVMAIGDAENDVPMFDLATIPVGVANADETVLGLGIRITDAAAGLGVAEALARWLPAR